MSSLRSLRIFPYSPVPHTHTPASQLAHVCCAQASVKDLGGEYVSVSELRANSPSVSHLIEQHRPAPGEVRKTRESGGLYHILMYCVLVDQLVRRVDRSLAAFFEQELAAPLGLVDMHPAISHELYHRLSTDRRPLSFVRCSLSTVIAIVRRNGRYEFITTIALML